LSIPRIDDTPHKPATRSVVGMDIFVEWDGSPTELGSSLQALTAGMALGLKMISNRGTMVFPARGATPSLVNQFRCRFVAGEDGEPTEADLLGLLAAVGARHRWMHIELLQEFDGVRAYTLAQGEETA
jgi:isocitrate dehydrogenase